MNDPRPIGYMEVQRGWIGEPATVHDTVQRYLHELDVSVQNEHPGVRPCGSRLEAVKDGAGVLHYTLYAGYAPFPPKQPPREQDDGEPVPPTPPLDPRNLNGAESPQIGSTPANMEDSSIGMKEQRFLV